MTHTGTILLTRGDVSSLLTMEECITGVEKEFKMHAEGKIASPQVLGVHVKDGGVHIKAGTSGKYIVAKANANFHLNAKLYNLPTIQGVIAVFDAVNGKLLALMDSIEITIIRTGAATALAAKYLALADAATVTICGCGNQGKISVKALRNVRSLKKIYAFDIDDSQVHNFCREFGREFEVVPTNKTTLNSALQHSQICITCTPSRQPFLFADDITPGTFIAAVGADSEDKHELSAEILTANKVVVDLLEQSAKIGELHHAIRPGQFSLSDIHAELGQVIAGLKPGRESSEEIIVFDSTGTALQDVAAATIVYEKAIRTGSGKRLNFLEEDNDALPAKISITPLH